MPKLWWGFVWRFLVFGMVSGIVFGGVAFLVPEAAVIVMILSWLALLGVSYIAFERALTAGGIQL